VAFFFTSATGRIALLLFGVDILLPFLLRKTRLSQALGIQRSSGISYLRRMWPHYWCGYLLLLFSAIHAWFSMQAATMSRLNTTGLWLATIAMGLLLLQLALGLLLQDRALPTRKLIRRWHYWIMLVLVAAIAAHVWLNG
jgi:hypothetical protein